MVRCIKTGIYVPLPRTSAAGEFLYVYAETACVGIIDGRLEKRRL
ncbi:MAG: hypothetical protein PUG41_06735 [Prevotellaceae bacterium]|nr:hypothetical protein [Prevotellaceae bacterium]